MAAQKESKETAALAVVPDRTRLTALTGTIAERIQAFEQIAANLAQIQLNGWDNVQKVKAACWLADGAGMHPATFVQNHYCMTIQGKLIVEPKMEFILGILQSRVPRFKFKIEEESDTRATVWMTDGTSEVRKSYDVEDARRLGLLSRGGNMLTSGATREWCLKQAFKKAGRTIGAAALMDLPVGDSDILNGDAPAPNPTEAIDQAIARATGKGVEVEFEEEPAASIEGSAVPPATDSPRVRLHASILKHYGKLSKQEAAAKVNEVYNSMMLEETGVDPKMAFKAGEVGPIEAERLIRYLEEKGVPPQPEASEPSPAQEETPEAEREVLSPKPGTQVWEAYDALMGTVLRARKLFSPRQFIQEAPPGSGKFWFVDGATFQQTGDKVSVKLQVGPDIVAPIAKLEALNKVLAAACDAKERGGR